LIEAGLIAPDSVMVCLTAALLVSRALVGHTQTHDGPLCAAHIIADAVHLLAAAAWLGGLFALGCLLTLANAIAAFMRFSGIGACKDGVILNQAAHYRSGI
jgi:putative copper export protein